LTHRPAEARSRSDPRPAAATHRRLLPALEQRRLRRRPGSSRRTYPLRRITRSGPTARDGWTNNTEPKPRPGSQDLTMATYHAAGMECPGRRDVSRRGSRCRRGGSGFGSRCCAGANLRSGALQTRTTSVRFPSSGVHPAAVRLYPPTVRDRSPHLCNPTGDAPLSSPSPRLSRPPSRSRSAPAVAGIRLRPA
jgi:hypothetical protein